MPKAHFHQPFFDKLNGSLQRRVPAVTGPALDVLGQPAQGGEVLDQGLGFIVDVDEGEEVLRTVEIFGCMFGRGKVGL